MQLKTLGRETQISRRKEIIKCAEIKWKRRIWSKSQKPFKKHKIVKSLIKLMNTRINDIGTRKGDILQMQKRLKIKENAVNNSMLINLSEIDSFLVKYK